MARAPRVRVGKAKGGRPSHDDVDLAVIRSAARAALEANLRLSSLLRLNVLIGAVPGNSKESAIRRVQLKARRIMKR